VYSVLVTTPITEYSVQCSCYYSYHRI